MTSPKGRWGYPTGPSACLALLLLTGCAIGGEDSSEVSDTPRRDLAGRPAAAAPASAAASSAGAASAGSGPAASTGTSGSTAPARASDVPAGTSSSPAGAAGSAAPYRTVGALTDASGDSGLGTPTYTDLRLVSIDDNGTSARVTVTVGSRLPARGAAGEALGIGVDLYRTAAQQESDYQLFADGGPDGWFAYLHTPKGFVRYPGTFALTGDGLTFTVPWRALGGANAGRFSAFADWTQRRTTGNAAGNDRAPLLGNTAYRR